MAPWHSDYRRITGDDLKAFLRSGPQADLPIDRDRTPMRDVERTGVRLVDPLA